MKFLRISEVIKKTALGRTTIWRWSSEGKFPKPIKLGSRITIWEESKIDEWMQQFTNN